MNVGKKIIIFLCTISGFSLQPTIVITVLNCNIKSECKEGSQCQNVCQFAGINAIGDIVKLPLRADTLKKMLGTITYVTETLVQFQKKDWRTEITYIPIQGHMAGKRVSLLFYNVDTQNTTEIETLPKKMRESMKKYQKQDPDIRYAFFILKQVRSNIWQEISEVYLAESSPDNVFIPVTVYPDGNIQIIIPAGEAAGETTYISIDQMS